MTHNQYQWSSENGHGIFQGSNGLIKSCVSCRSHFEELTGTTGKQPAGIYPGIRTGQCGRKRLLPLGKRRRINLTFVLPDPVEHLHALDRCGDVTGRCPSLGEAPIAAHQAIQSILWGAHLKAGQQLAINRIGGPGTLGPDHGPGCRCHTERRARQEIAPVHPHKTWPAAGTLINTPQTTLKAQIKQ